MAEHHFEYLPGKVYATYLGGFGDCWAAASYFLQLSEKFGSPVLVSHIDERIAEIIPYLQSNGIVTDVSIDPEIVIGTEHRILQNYSRPIPKTIQPWCHVLGQPYLPTRLLWYSNQNRLFTYQLESRYPGDASCTLEDCRLLITSLKNMGYQGELLGQHNSLEDNIRLAASSEFFVGIDSGISHLCHSVGVPIHLLQNRLTAEHIAATHRNKIFTLHKNVAEFLAYFHSRKDSKGDIPVIAGIASLPTQQIATDT